MTDIYTKTPIRIPVKLVDGQWEYFYGGGLHVCNGAVGDLVIDKRAIEDKKFLALLKQTSEYKILGVGTDLRVALTIKPTSDIDDSLRKCLIQMNAQELSADYFHSVRSADTQFVKVSIGEPTPRQKKMRPEDNGGIWLRLQGTQTKDISTSRVIVPAPVSEYPLESLNHAFTRLSEKYEPWRKSHTGNIYDRVLYQEKNGRWYPLNVLRNAAVAKDEHELIRHQWELLSKQFSFMQPNSNER